MTIKKCEKCGLEKEYNGITSSSEEDREICIDKRRHDWRVGVYCKPKLGEFK